MGGRVAFLADCGIIIWGSILCVVEHIDPIVIQEVY